MRIETASPSRRGVEDSATATLPFFDACVNPEELDYLNAHAAGTPVGDRAEARVLQLALEDAVSRVPVSSTKSMPSSLKGHLLSGGGSRGSPGLPSRDRAASPPAHDQNSFGFGGSNTCLVFRQAARQTSPNSPRVRGADVKKWDWLRADVQVFREIQVVASRPSQLFHSLCAASPTTRSCQPSRIIFPYVPNAWTSISCTSPRCRMKQHRIWKGGIRIKERGNLG